MNTILVPISKSAPKEKIKKSIQLIVDKRIDRILLLHITTYPSATELNEVIAAQTDQIEEEIIENDKKDMANFAEELKLMGYKVETIAPIGFFDQEFIGTSNKLDPDYVLMFTAGSHSWIEDLFGTHTSSIFEKIKSPIFVIPYESTFDQLSKAIVSLSMENEDLHVIKEYIRFADEHKIESAFVKIDNHYQLDIINDEQILHKFKQLYPGKMEELVHRASENVAKGLEDYSKEVNADLIVLFTTKRDLIEKLFHKSITKDLVLHSKKPLLIYHY